MALDYSKILEADVIVDYLVARHKQGLYSLVLTTGLPGSGKSSADLRLAEVTSIKLTGENIITPKNIIGSLLELLEFVQGANENEVNIAVVEEISVLFPSRRAMSSDNVSVAKILDTCRKKKVILIANAPIWTSVDSHLRALGNVYLETLRINREFGVVICKSFRLQTNPNSGKTYFHYFRRNGQKVHRIVFRKPNSKTWEDYEAKKDKFLVDLYEELKFRTQKKQEEKLKEMGKTAKTEIVRPLTPMELKVYDGIYKQNKSQTKVAEELDCSVSNIHQIVNRIKKKVTISLGNEPLKVQKVDIEPFK